MDIQQSLKEKPQFALAHQMRSDEFLRQAIAVTVNPTMVGGVKVLVCTEATRPAFLRLHEAFCQLAPKTASDADAWANERVTKLFSECFQNDIWHARLPTGQPVVFVKEAAMDGRIELDDVLRRVHVSEITRALTDGLNVPTAVLDDYRALLDSFSAAREVY